MSGAQGDDHDLEAKVRAWLRAEGYPLEFATASAFDAAGFEVLQAEYTQPTHDRPRREVDVVVHMTSRDDGILRVEYVVECEWSANKPWVFVCGGRGITSAACVTQTIGSAVAETLLWKEAGNPVLHDLGLFRDLGIRRSAAPSFLEVSRRCLRCGPWGNGQLSRAGGRVRPPC
jgi:hypothetical protein